MDNGKFKRGQAFVKYEWITEGTGATKAQIDHFIRWAKEAQMLATEKATRGMFINVLKYEVFQDLDNYKSDTKSDLEATQKRHRSDTINNNDNNDKNEKNNTLPPVGGEMIKTNSSNEVKELFDVFHLKGILQNYANKTHRQCAKDLIAKYGLDGAKRLAGYAISILGQEYAPTINNPYELKSKLASLNSYMKKQNKQNTQKVYDSTI